MQYNDCNVITEVSNDIGQISVGNLSLLCFESLDELQFLKFLIYDAGVHINFYKILLLI